MKTSVSSISGNRWAMVSLLFVLIFSAHAVMGQQSNSGTYQKPSAEDRAKQQTQMMKDELKLTATQEPKVYAINLKYIKMNDVARTGATDKDKVRKILQKNNEGRKAELKKILTAEQIDLYVKKRQEMKNKPTGGQH